MRLQLTGRFTSEEIYEKLEALRKEHGMDMFEHVNICLFLCNKEDLGKTDIVDSNGESICFSVSKSKIRMIEREGWRNGMVENVFGTERPQKNKKAKKRT